MDDELAAGAMAALGNPTRLAIFRLLVRAGEAGFAVGEVQARTGLPASTLAHHLDTLERAGLIGRRRAGREVRCSVRFERVHALVDHILEACCVEEQLARDEPEEAWA